MPTSNADAALTQQAALVMQNGSASFSLASRLLGRDARDAVLMLYQWFRHCDDVIDGQQGGWRSALAEDRSVDARLKDLTTLEAATQAAVNGTATEPAFVGLSALVRRYDLPAAYLADFLAGMRMDVEGFSPEILGDLKLYCYRVAGTVGLLFSRVVGVSDVSALHHATHLGIAMQMSNIARDVGDDHRAGRCYLPHQWLAAVGIDPRAIMAPEHRDALVQLVRCLVVTADQYYRSGDAGLKYLPMRAAVAVAAARHIYAAIGHAVVARGPKAWDSRTIISLPRKLWCIAKAVAIVAASIPGRLRRPWQAAAIPNTWRYT